MKQPPPHNIKTHNPVHSVSNQWKLASAHNWYENYQLTKTWLDTKTTRLNQT